MPRRKRIQRPGIYHLMSCGVDRCDIYLDDYDRILWIALYAKTLARFGWESLIYCEMTTHFHLLVRTREPNLARGMQWLLGTYALAFNQRHGRVGHLVRGRYVSVPVEAEAQLSVSWTYIAYNPVRAGLCKRPHEWPWMGVSPGRPLPDWDMPGV
jgi:REP element-mobilizing transposase RayT